MVPEVIEERLVPGISPEEVSQEHVARYVLASRYCLAKDILDVASGTGYGTDYLPRSGATAVGLEIDMAALQYALSQYPMTRYVHGSAMQMPRHWTGAYDAVISFETIEHLDEPLRFLAEVRRCLLPGGVFLCSTPNKSLYLFEGHNRFHIKEFYFREFVRVIGNHFRITDVPGQSFHPRWQVPFRALHALVRRGLRGLGVPPLGISTVTSNSMYSSPFEGGSIAPEKVLSEFMPTAVRGSAVPTFLIVVARKEE